MAKGIWKSKYSEFKRNTQIEIFEIVNSYSLTIVSIVCYFNFSKAFLYTFNLLNNSQWYTGKILLSLLMKKLRLREVK